MISANKPNIGARAPGISHIRLRSRERQVCAQLTNHSLFCNSSFTTGHIRIYVYSKQFYPVLAQCNLYQNQIQSSSPTLPCQKFVCRLLSRYPAFLPWSELSTMLNFAFLWFFCLYIVIPYVWIHIAHQIMQFFLKSLV